MRNILIIAGKEFRDGIRNRWVIALIILLASLASTLAILGSAPVGNVDSSQFNITVVSLASLSVYLVPLIALILSYDAIVGEYERGTLLLLFTYPIRRVELIAGKFLGHLLILTVALVGGYGLVFGGMSLYLDVSANDITAAAVLILTSIMLGAIFILLGYIASLLFRERATSAGAAIGIWLVMVILYDLALLGLLLSDTTQSIGPGLFSFLMHINPADAFRIFNLSNFENARAITGMTIKNAQSGAVMALFWMGVWIVIAGASSFILVKRYRI